MISVIVPIYNVKTYLEEAIESVIHQTYTDIEIILVDDGSTDGSGELCDEYAKKDNRIIVIHQNNRGLSAARNAGLEICKGDIIAFLDSDDAFHYDMLSKMFNAMIKSEADIVECNYSVFKYCKSFSDSIIGGCTVIPGIEKAVLYNKIEALHMHLDRKLASNVWNKIYKRKIWENLRFTEGQNYEDVDIVLPLLERANRIFVIDDNLIKHRKRFGSITLTNSFDNIRDLVIGQRNYANFVLSHVPEYFNEQDANNALTKLYSLLIGRYFYYCSIKIPGKKKSLEYLIKEIEEIKKSIDIKKCNIRIQTANFFLFHMPPFVLGIIYLLYRPVRSLTLKFFQK